VIVAEGGGVTIYDGDDPSLPMWMVFVVSFGRMVGQFSPKVVMLNGRMITGGNINDANCTDFIGDRGANSFNYRSYKGSIAQRNDDLGYNATGSAPWYATSNIVWRTVNDVAMTVLPDNGLDLATQLPKVDIAVATDGNGTYLASIIKSDGNVYDVGADGGSEAVSVSLDGSKLTVVRADGTVFVWNDIGEITSDGASPDATYSTSSTPALLGTISEVAA
jgi:hypothetical protein